jgi:hypothetical protein
MSICIPKLASSLRRVGTRLVWLACLLGFLTPEARAQRDDKRQSLADSAALNGLYGDFAAPDLTAPTLLGVAGSRVAKPASVRALAGSLLGAAAGAQQSGTGFGLEVAPAQLWRLRLYKDPANPNLTKSLIAYRHPLNVLLRGLTMSGASLTDSTGARLALGAGLAFDRTDPLLDKDHVEAIAKGLLKVAEIATIHTTVGTNGTAARDMAKKVLRAGLSREPDLAKKDPDGLLYDGLLELLLLPTETEETPASFARHRQLEREVWNKLVDSLVDRGSLTRSQATALKEGAAQPVLAVIDAYSPFQLDVATFNEATRAVLKKENDQFTKHLWNATVMQVGMGWTWHSPSQAWRGFERQSFGMFLRGAFRGAGQDWNKPAATKVQHWLYDHAQLVVLGQYNAYHGGSDPLPVKPTATADSLVNKRELGLRALVGNTWFRLSAEYLVQRYAFTHATQDAATVAKRQLRDDVRSATLGAEVRLAENLWLEFAFGTTYSASDRADARLLTLGALKYAVRNRQRFKTH